MSSKNKLGAISPEQKKTASSIEFSLKDRHYSLFGREKIPQNEDDWRELGFLFPQGNPFPFEINEEKNDLNFQRSSQSDIHATADFYQEGKEEEAKSVKEDDKLSKNKNSITPSPSNFYKEPLCWLFFLMIVALFLFFLIISTPIGIWMGLRKDKTFS